MYNDSCNEYSSMEVRQSHYKDYKKKGVKKEESSNGFYDLNMYTYSSCTLMLVFKLLD